MCILCVASRWSRRIVTMLPWLIIPLIILWALSQLLPPGFRFEVTSPRLACVAVLLVSLGWYELAMPRLSQWRERRKDMLRERRRIEAQEAAKWRKEATRRCRNCLSAYRDQSPGGGRFMCTFCGHVSKRPVLDVPGAGTSVPPGAAMGGLGQGGVSMNPGGVGAAGGLFGRNPKGWNGRGWPERAGWGQGRPWPNGKQQWPSGVGAWGAVNGAWTGPSWPGGGWAGTGAYWAGGGAWAGGFGSSYSGGFFSEKCASADPHYGGILCGLFRLLHLVSFFKVFSLLFFLLRWSWSRLTGDTAGDDSAANSSRRGGQRRGDDVNGSQGTRGEKARRKAEEKKQARLEREQLEAEERRQREEVARLVEERRKLRDEKLEAERESEREAAAEREREIRREREAERRRQDKLREKEKEAAKDKTKDTDSEGSKRKKEKEKEKEKEKGKENDRKTDGERKGDTDRKVDMKPQVGPDYRKGVKGSKGTLDAGPKGEVGLKTLGGNPAKTLNARYQGSSVKGPSLASKNGVVNQSNSSYFWKNSGKSTKGAAHVSSSPSPPSVANGGNIVKTADSSYSAWKVWPKGWGKVPLPAPEGTNAVQLPVIKGMDTSSSSGVQLLKSEAISSTTSDLQTMVGVPSEQSTAQTKPWQRLFSNSNATLQPSADLNPEGQQQLKQPIEQSAHFVPTELVSDSILTSTSQSGGSHGHSSACLASLSMGSAVHVPASSAVLAPISAPSSANASTTHSSISLVAAASVMPPMLGCSSAAVTSIITPLHARVSAPMQVPVSLPLPITSQGQDHVPQDQLPQILEPWATPKLTVDNLDIATDNKWKMWEAPQLDQIHLPLVDSWMPFENGELDQQKDTSGPLAQAVPLEPEMQWSSCLFPPMQQQGSPGRSPGDPISTAPLASSNSLWSDQSAFADRSAFTAPPRLWGDSNVLESQQLVPAEFVDCITQEVMHDPVITADGHSYERKAIEKWLKYHDTSPITGEVLPPPPGATGKGVDKTLRPNHILRGQIIEYNERLARRSIAQDVRDSGWRPLVGTSPWSISSAMERQQLGSFYTSYTAPGAQSVWSYNAA